MLVPAYFLFPLYEKVLPQSFNPLPNHKIWALTKLKAVAEEKFNVAEMLISLFDWVENIVGKGENADYQHFLLFPTMFSKGLFLGVFNPFPNNKFYTLPN